MLRAVEAVHGSLGDAECPAADYLSLKAEETEANEPTAAPLDEIISKLASSSSSIQSTVDGSGHIRVTRTKQKSKMPSTTEEYRKVMKVEMFAWLAMASRYKSKHWLHGLTSDPFLKFVEYILGDRVYGIQIPTSDGAQQKLRPDWSIILAYEQKLRKEAMKLVMQGHTMSDALTSVIKDADLKEAYFTTPVALKASLADGQPHKWQRFNSKGSYNSASKGSFSGGSKGKGKGKSKSKSSNAADGRLKGLNLAWRTPDNRELCFAWNSGECSGACGRVHQCRVKGCYADHKAIEHKQKRDSWHVTGAADPGMAAPHSPGLTTPSDGVPLVKVMYLFAGGRRRSDVAAYLKEAEASGKIRLILKEFDVERSPEHDLTNVALWTEIIETLEEGQWFIIVSPPCNTFSRARFQRRHPGPRPLRTKAWPRGFPWLSNANRQKVEEANFFVDKCVEACEHAFNFNGFFILEHPEDLGVVDDEHPGSIWQWREVLDLIPKCKASCFAIHQCKFGAITPKPTRLLTNLKVSDERCYLSLPRFDKLGFYKGPLPRKCGHRHVHTLIGKTGTRWNTSPSAAYPPQMCKFLADLILNAAASFGGGTENPIIKRGNKRPHDADSQTVSKSRKLEGEGPVQVTSETTPKAAVHLVQDSDEEVATAAIPTTVDASKLKGGSPPGESPCGAAPTGESPAETGDQFDLQACYNSGIPIQVEWDNASRGFIDGFGLCSPTRWRPQHRGTFRPPEMVRLADSTFDILAECVGECIHDVRLEAFKLVTGKLESSPFSESALVKLRERWASLLPDPADAAVVDPGQPFFLRALAQWLKVFKDPDVQWLMDEPDSFATGVNVGVEQPLPRSPQVFPEKGKHRKMDETEFCPIADNYPSAQLSTGELEKKFREEELLGRMHPSKLGVLRQEFGDKLRIASMAAISKPDGSVRPLHDATHSVMVNHEIKYQDKIICPGPAEIAGVVRESSETQEAPFCVSADIKAAHRLVKVRQADWGYLCCRANSSSDTVWVNRVGTFGVSSAPYWWAKLAGLIGRFVGYIFQSRWFMQMIYVDDLHGSFVGADKFRLLWIWILAYEMVGTPFGYHKFKGGFSSEFVGFHMRYDLSEVGISKKRGDWLVEWIQRAGVNKYVVAAREFIEFLGRLGFVSQLLTWMKPHLSPLFAWASITSKGTVGRLPETVILTLLYILHELRAESYLVSVKRPANFDVEVFRTDAKCADNFIVLAGWEITSRRWFSIRFGPSEAPFLFKPTGESQWASTSAELLATLVALVAFGWVAKGRTRKSLAISLAGGTDNRANDALTIKRATTKWPLMAINMQLSAVLARARLMLRLRWRPREENVEADDLTNERFSGFDVEKRINMVWHDLDLEILQALVQTRKAFEQKKVEAKAGASNQAAGKSKKFDKTPW